MPESLSSHLKRYPPTKRITNKEYEEWQKYKAEKAEDHVLLPDTVRFICEANVYDAEKIHACGIDISEKMIDGGSVYCRY